MAPEPRARVRLVVKLEILCRSVESTLQILIQYGVNTVTVTHSSIGSSRELHAQQKCTIETRVKCGTVYEYIARGAHLATPSVRRVIRKPRGGEGESEQIYRGPNEARGGGNVNRGDLKG